MSTASVITSAPATPRKELTFFQWCVAIVLLTFCATFLIGSAADAYCEMQFAKRPIRGACAHVIKKLGDVLGLAPLIIPFLGPAPVPPIEYHTYQAGPDGMPTEQIHDFTTE